MVKDPAKLREERFILAYGLAVHHGEVILGVVEGACNMSCLWFREHDYSTMGMKKTNTEETNRIVGLGVGVGGAML